MKKSLKRARYDAYCPITYNKHYVVNHSYDYKQLLDEVFVISGIIKVEVSVIGRSRRLRLITLTETLIIPNITKTESNNCFIIQATLIFVIIEAILTSLSANLTLLSVHLTLLLEIMHCARNLQIIH